jgi:hypothetical protein
VSDSVAARAPAGASGRQVTASSAYASVNPLQASAALSPRNAHPAGCSNTFAVSRTPTSQQATVATTKVTSAGSRNRPASAGLASSATVVAS